MQDLEVGAADACGAALDEHVAGPGDGVSISTPATSFGRSITTAFIARAYTAVWSARVRCGSTDATSYSHRSQTPLLAQRSPVRRPTPARPGAKGDAGATGATGASGAQGTTARTERTASAGTRFVPGATRADAHSDSGPGYVGVGFGAIATVACSPGKLALGGGYRFTSAGDNGFNLQALCDGSGVIASFPGRMDWSTNTVKRTATPAGSCRSTTALNPADMTLYVIYVNAN